EQAEPAKLSADNPGFEVFQAEGCGACHTIRGTDAQGPVGPDLTHLASRDKLGAGMWDMTPTNMARWITDTHEMKPDIDMPPYPHLHGARLDTLVDFLMRLE
ncbi:MAG TPA: cytochrome c oxidase subunit II, partial [Citreicella sp.]|nr:cytochrome c oxidase subunit II [Citreicella sp.]